MLWYISASCCSESSIHWLREIFCPLPRPVNLSCRKWFIGIILKLEFIFKNMFLNGFIMKIFDLLKKSSPHALSHYFAQNGSTGFQHTFGFLLNMDQCMFKRNPFVKFPFSSDADVILSCIKWLYGTFCIWNSDLNKLLLHKFSLKIFQFHIFLPPHMQCHIILPKVV